MSENSKQRKEFKRYRAREDFKLQLYKFMMAFESKEEPKVKLTEKDYLIVFLELAKNKIEVGEF